MPDVLTGGCQCGALRYAVSAAPLEVYVCHCTECRRQSGSAFGVSVYVPSEAVRLTAGEPVIWTRPGMVAGPCDCAFCGVCGSRIWHRSRAEADITSLKGGTLDRPVDLGRAIHVWTGSALPGVIIPSGAEAHAEEPPEGA